MSVKVDVLTLYKSVCLRATANDGKNLDKDEQLLLADMIEKIGDGDIVLLDTKDYEELETIRLEDEAVQYEIQIAMDILKQTIKDYEESEDE